MRGHEASPKPGTDVLSRNLAHAVYDLAERSPDLVTFRMFPGMTEVRAGEFAEQVAALAKGLIAAGVQAGDRVLLMSRPRYEWTLADYAIWSAGAISVPVYETCGAEQVRWILGDSGAEHCLVESEEQARLVRTAAGRAAEPRHVWTIEEEALDTLCGQGSAVSSEELVRRRESVRPQSVATIIYTSGTTGRAKGVSLTHGNLLANLGPFLDVLGPTFRVGASTVIYLSLAHIFSRIMRCGAVARGVCLTHARDPNRLGEALAHARPTFLAAVPRTLEKLRDDAAPMPSGADPGRGADVAAGLPAVLGDRCDTVIIGGAPPSAELVRCYGEAGISVYEGYGLTETAGAVTINGPRAVKIGTCGPPIPGVDVRVVGDGEILLRGECVFGGYWRQPDATDEAFVDGWFRTGDLGELDDDGYLRITGRKKELIITTGGKNVDHVALEARLREHPLINNAMVVGDGRPFVACLVTVDSDAWRGAESADSQPRPAASVADSGLRAEIAAAVEAANKSVSRAESIRAFGILDSQFTVAGGELTPSLKLRRATVLDKYASEIDALYRGEHA